MSKSYKFIETKLIHAGEPDSLISGAVSMPIFQSSTFEYAGEGSYDDVRYIRLNNTPNHIVLSHKLAALENAEAALVTASGMAAISATLLTILSPGDHLLAQDCLYGGTHSFITEQLITLGIECDFIDPAEPDSWGSKLRPNTRAVYVEAMSNPLLQVADLHATVDFARKNKLVSLIDNTFATPINFRPAEHGFDISLHSCTKYMNGHSDIVSGACIGRADLIDRIRHTLNHLGGSLDPHACFLLHRGLKTMALRVRYQNQSALRIAEFFRSHPRISKVNYPGLETHPQYSLSRKLFEGFGGMMSIELKGGVEDAERFIHEAKIPICAPSLGGVETLMTRPATTSHAGVPPSERQRLGISDSLIRISIGIENTDELIEDFRQALAN